jgi:hypothetical protein
MEAVVGGRVRYLNVVFGTIQTYNNVDSILHKTQGKSEYFIISLFINIAKFIRMIQLSFFINE